jgi:hypothetical protein
MDHQNSVSGPDLPPRPVRRLKPNPTRLALFINVRKFFFLSVVIANPNWKWIAKRPLNLAAMDADGNFRMSIRVNKFDGQ